MSERSSKIRSSLSKHLPQPATAPEELRQMAMRAWRLQGIAMLKPDQIADPWVRQTVINEAERLYGARSNPGERALVRSGTTDKRG